MVLPAKRTVISHITQLKTSITRGDFGRVNGMGKEGEDATQGDSRSDASAEKRRKKRKRRALKLKTGTVANSVE